MEHEQVKKLHKEAYRLEVTVYKNNAVLSSRKWYHMGVDANGTLTLSNAYGSRLEVYLAGSYDRYDIEPAFGFDIVERI